MLTNFVLVSKAMLTKLENIFKKIYEKNVNTPMSLEESVLLL